MARLNDLVDGAMDNGIEITGLTSDSRQVAPGFLFAALPGSRVDGRKFIGEAIDRGAVAVLADSATPWPQSSRAAHIRLIPARNPRLAFARMAARFFGRQPRTVVGVTGTNGKTSVCAFARQIWSFMGHRAASMGTLGLMAPDFERSGALTTPDPVALHEDLAMLVDREVTHLAMEASSHGLHQYRLHGVNMSAGAFLNLTRDHLDYHGSEEAYFEAKAQLFSEVLPPGTSAILNADSPWTERLEPICRERGQRIVSFGRQGREVRLIAQTLHQSGQRLAIEVFGEAHEANLPLVGAFQASNALAALSLVLAAGGPQEGSRSQRIGGAVAALSALSGVPGRLERVARLPNGATVYVDYAHTPDALEHVLKALRPHGRGRLIVVFGAGGDRDPGKRPEMGAIAARFADLAIVTDDNPRSEDPARIRAEIRAACPEALEIGSRSDAIVEAVRMLEPGDVLLLAGKGHETGQIIGETTTPQDDRAEAKAAVAARTTQDEGRGT